MRTAAATFVLGLALAGGADAKDAVSYPEGVSTQTLDGHLFELIVPKAAETPAPYGLLLAITDAGVVPEQLLPIAKDGFVIVLPKGRFGAGEWATSETKDIHDDVDAVASAFAVAKERMHLLAVHVKRGFASFVAFDKRRSFASLAYSETEWTNAAAGKSPPSEAKKRLGVLLMGEGQEPTRFADPVKFAADLADKVRCVEYRRDETALKPYYRYWLSAMDGRFVPGRDLSFDWIADVAPAPAKQGSREPPAAAPKPALDAARDKRAPAFVYFFAADDVGKPEAKALQNEVFFDAEVRAAAKRLVAVKLERSKYEKAFAEMGLKTTPAVVLVDADFNVVERFEGAVAAKPLAKAMTKAAPKSK